MDILNAQDEDMIRIIEGVLGFYGGCAVQEDRVMAERVLSAIAGEQKRRADAEVEAMHRYERSRREMEAILQSRAAMEALDLRVAHYRATRSLREPYETPEWELEQGRMERADLDYEPREIPGRDDR